MVTSRPPHETISIRQVPENTDYEARFVFDPFGSYDQTIQTCRLAPGPVPRPCIQRYLGSL